MLIGCCLLRCCQRRQQHGCGSGCSAQHSRCLEQYSNDSKPSCHPSAAAAPPPAASSAPAESAPATSSSSSEPAAAQPQVPREHCPVGRVVGLPAAGGMAWLRSWGSPAEHAYWLPGNPTSRHATRRSEQPAVCHPAHLFTQTHAVPSAACSQAATAQPSSSTAAAVALPAAVAFPATPLTPTSQPKVG